MKSSAARGSRVSGTAAAVSAPRMPSVRLHVHNGAGPGRNRCAARASRRDQPFGIPGARIVASKPGVTYWRKDRDAGAATQLTDLLTFEGIESSLITDAPETVGVNLNASTDPTSRLLTLDLNNCDIDVATDAIHPAPACNTTVRLPNDWRECELTVTCVCPEKPEFPLPTGNVVLDRGRGTLRLQTPPFETALMVCIRPGAAKQAP